MYGMLCFGSNSRESDIMVKHGIEIDIQRDEDDEAWDMIISHRGETIRTENDYMEEEDAMFICDLEWIPDAILQVYELGYKDGLEG